MGSKKKKQTPKKPVSTAPAVDTVTKKRLDLARKLYRERIRSLNSMSKLDPLHREAMDCDEIRAKRRMTAAVNLFDDVAAVARPICPDVEGVSDFEYEWLSHNVMPRMSFDWNERICSTVLAAAMWMLDQLREYGYFHEACKLFPRDERIFEELELPDIWDTSHEEDALYAMSWIIHHRNDDCTGIRAADKEQLARPYMDLYTAANQHRQDVPSRQMFEKILAMIPPQEIEQAVQLFEKTWWELVRRYYINRNVYSQLQQKIDAKFSSYARKTEMLAEDLKGATTRLKQQTDTPPLVLAARHPWEQNILPNMHRAAQERSELLLRAKQLEEQEAVLEEEQEHLDFAMQAYLDTLGDILTIPKSQRDENVLLRSSSRLGGLHHPGSLCSVFRIPVPVGSGVRSTLGLCHFPAADGTVRQCPALAV